MGDLLASPLIADVIIGMVVLEGVLLALILKGRAGALVWSTLASGLFLTAALRGALAGSGPVWIGASLFCALLAHGWFLAAVWLRRPSE